jgi:hypothetical protein
MVPDLQREREDPSLGVMNYYRCAGGINDVQGRFQGRQSQDENKRFGAH